METCHVVLTTESVTMQIETSSAVCSHGTICFIIIYFYKMKFEIFLEFCYLALFVVDS